MKKKLAFFCVCLLALSVFYAVTNTHVPVTSAKLDTYAANNPVDNVVGNVVEGAGDLVGGAVDGAANGAAGLAGGAAGLVSDAGSLVDESAFQNVVDQIGQYGKAFNVASTGLDNALAGVIPGTTLPLTQAAQQPAQTTAVNGYDGVGNYAPAQTQGFVMPEVQATLGTEAPTQSTTAKKISGETLGANRVATITSSKSGARTMLSILAPIILVLLAVGIGIFVIYLFARRLTRVQQPAKAKDGENTTEDDDDGETLSDLINKANGR